MRILAEFCGAIVIIGVFVFGVLQVVKVIKGLGKAEPPKTDDTQSSQSKGE